ncbi:MAG: hypothetical protein V1882_01960 [Candidatus Omnitrophota bacterium]
MNNVGFCKLCKTEKVLIGAHIIPKSLYMLEPSKEPTKLVSNNPGEYPKKCPVGVYDQNILCENCDRNIGKWDEYAAQLFRREFTENNYILDSDGAKLAYRVGSFDYDKLKLFYLSLLWRAGVSSQAFFSKVNLGIYEADLHAMILKESPGSADQFSVVISKFDHDSRLVPPLNPQRARFDGVNVYQVYFYGYMSLVKVDRRKQIPGLGEYAIKPGGELIILLREYRNSKEFSIMRDLVERSRISRQ